MRRGSRRSFVGAADHGRAPRRDLRWRSRPRTARPQAPIIVQRDFVQAEMVKLGKPRDKFWLPRITQPPPPPPPDAIKIADDPNAKPAPVEAPKLEDPKTSKEREARARARGEAGRAGGAGGARRRRRSTDRRSGRRTARSATRTTRRSSARSRRTTTCPPGMTPEQIAHAARDPVQGDRGRNHRRGQADQVVRQSARRRRLRQRRAADAQGAAAAGGPAARLRRRLPEVDGRLGVRVI